MTRRFLASGVLVAAAAALSAQGVTSPASPVPPTNDAPNPYATVEGWARMPEGRTWGSTSAVDIDRDGRSIWVAERCSANSCWDAANQRTSPLDVVLHFDESGRVVKSFGAGMFVFPHGIYVDKDGNIWVTDGQDNLPRRGRGAAADAPLPAPPAKVIGHQVYKFSPDGTLLLALGKPGGNQPGQPADPASFYQPNDVITNDRGEIFVCEGHGDSVPPRIVKLDPSGKFIKAIGSLGSGPGQFIQPHAFAWDSKGRLFVADRSNNRIQILDQDLNVLEVGWQQYSRISGLFITPDDMLFAADSESGSVAPARKDWTRGIRVGRVADGPNGKVLAFIPDPEPAPRSTSSAEGVAVDRAGNVYGAEVGQRALKKYTKR
jgi:hypothetical protein